MDPSSEIVGGAQNDQTGQEPSGDQNEKSDDQKRREKKRATDRESKERKKKKMEESLTELANEKAKTVELEKELMYTKGRLDQLIKDTKRDNGIAKTLHEIVVGQKTMINMIEPSFFQRSFEGTLVNTFSTKEASLPVQNPQIYFETGMSSGGLTMNESSGLHQPIVPRAWAHGNSEQPASASDDNDPTFDVDKCFNPDG